MSMRARWRKSWYGWRSRSLNYKKGWRSKQPILVIESDDWGAEHVPGADALEEMKKGTSAFESCYLNYDGLERPEDIERLCEVLRTYRDANGRPAVMTMNFVMANPDFKAVEQSGYSVFRAKTIDEGFNHEPEGDRLRKSYRRGIEGGMLVPQLHGQLHFCPDDWLERLRQGEAGTLKAFKLRMVGENSNANGIGIQSMAPIYHTSKESIRHLVEEGVRTFRQVFNMSSLTTIAPCYAWRTPETEQALLSNGVLAMQGREYQCLPNGSVKPHYSGELGPGGILYMIRTCRLEPISARTSVDECFAQIRDAFARRVPAVLSSHRVNYTSRVDRSIRDKGLATLNGVLKRVTQAYPDVEFLSSDKLALRILQTN